MRVLREFFVISFVAIACGLAWYVALGIRGTIYLTRHADETSFPASAAWHPGYTWAAVVLAIAIGAAAMLVVVVRRRLLLRGINTQQRCPCCGYRTLAETEAYEICPVCFWEDDGQTDADASKVYGGPNGELSLAQARANFHEFGAVDRRFLENVRSPRKSGHS